MTKCRDDDPRLNTYYRKLQELAQKLSGTAMSHSQFLVMMRSDKTICDLSNEEWKKRKFSYKSKDCLLCRKLGI